MRNHTLNIIRQDKLCQEAHFFNFWSQFTSETLLIGATRDLTVQDGERPNI